MTWEQNQAIRPIELCHFIVADQFFPLNPVPLHSPRNLWRPCSSRNGQCRCWCPEQNTKCWGGGGRVGCLLEVWFGESIVTGCKMIIMVSVILSVNSTGELKT